MRSGKGARFCDDTGLGFNPCSFIHGLRDLGQVSFNFFPYLGRGVNTYDTDCCKVYTTYVKNLALCLAQRGLISGYSYNISKKKLKYQPPFPDLQKLSGIVCN